MSGAPQFPDPLGSREVYRPGATMHKAGADLPRKVLALEQGALGRPGPGVADWSVPTADTTKTGGVEWKKGAYTAPTFTGTWAHYGSTIRDVGYTLLPGGVVMLNGSAKRTGTTGLTLFTLPAGYRPSETLIFAVITSAVAAGVARLDVNADGTVVLQVADPGIAITFTALDGISFLAGV